MFDAIFWKTYSLESKRVIRFPEERGREEKNGKSYDVYENNKLKIGHVGNTYDVDENTGSCLIYPTMLMKNKAVSHIGRGALWSDIWRLSA